LARPIPGSDALGPTSAHDSPVLRAGESCDSRHDAPPRLSRVRKSTRLTAFKSAKLGLARVSMPSAPCVAGRMPADERAHARFRRAMGRPWRWARWMGRAV